RACARSCSRAVSSVVWAISALVAGSMRLSTWAMVMVVPSRRAAVVVSELATRGAIGVARGEVGVVRGAGPVVWLAVQLTPRIRAQRVSRISDATHARG